MHKLKPMPTFETEEEEREFWKTHDSTDYVRWEKAAASAVSLGILDYASNPLFSRLGTILAAHINGRGPEGVQEVLGVLKLHICAVTEAFQEGWEEKEC